MLESLGRGDKVMLSSGIFGTVLKIDDEKSIVTMELSKNNVVEVLRESIGEVVEKRKGSAKKGGK